MKLSKARRENLISITSPIGPAKSFALAPMSLSDIQGIRHVKAFLFGTDANDLANRVAKQSSPRKTETGSIERLADRPQIIDGDDRRFVQDFAIPTDDVNRAVHHRNIQKIADDGRNLRRVMPPAVSFAACIAHHDQPARVLHLVGCERPQLDWQDFWRLA